LQKRVRHFHQILFLFKVCYIPPELLEPNEHKPKTVSDSQNNRKKSLAQRKQASKVPKSEKILFGESISPVPKLTSICPTFDDSNTIYTKAGKRDSLLSASESSLGSATVVAEPLHSSTVATQLNETKTTVKVTEVTMFRTKKYDSSSKATRIFESKNTESKTKEEKFVDSKMIESKTCESRDLSLTASERKNLVTKAVEVRALEVKKTEVGEDAEFTTKTCRSMETKTLDTVETASKLSVEKSSQNRLDSVLNRSLPDLGKFFLMRNRW